MAEAHHSLGFSQLEKRDRCPASMKKEEGMPNENSDVAAMGTRLHEAVWSDSVELDDDEVYLVEYANTEIQALACEFGIASWIGEQTMPIDHEGQKICFGTVDGHSDINRRSYFAILLEFKFGFKEVAPSRNNIQVAAGSLALKQKFPWLKRVLAVVIMPRLRQTFRYEFKEFDQIENYIWNIRQRCVNASGNMHNPGPHCVDGYCRAIRDCQGVDEVKAEIAATSTTAITIDNADAMYEKALIVERQLKAIKAQCKAVVIEGGGSAGRLSVTEAKGGRYIPDLQKAYEKVQHLMTVEEFLGSCEAKIGKIEKDIISRAVEAGEYPTKKAAKASFNELVGVAFGPSKTTINLRKE